MAFQTDEASRAVPVTLLPTSAEPAERDVARETVADPPQVSVVITCHNHARFLNAAIASAKAQSLRSLEIIVVNDGSTDNSGDVLSHHAGIGVIHQENRGLSAARNVGLRAARGAFITFLDADDMLLPHALAAGLSYLRGRPDCAFVAGGHRLVDGNGRYLTGPIVPDATGDHYLSLLHRNHICMHAAVLYRREALLAVGGFDERLHAAEDYDVYLRIACNRPIILHDTVVALYRQHGDNMSAQHDRMLCNVIATLEKQRDHCAGDPMRHAALLHGLRLCRRNYGELLLKRAMTRLLNRRTRAQGGEDMKFLYRHTAGAIPSIIVWLARHASVRTVAAWLPDGMREWVRARRRPPVGRIDFGSLRRVTPISTVFGFDRGLPIDRYYIEAFLQNHAEDIGGRVLEIGDNTYTVRFSGDRLVHSDVLNVKPGGPLTTIVGDLSDAPDIPSDHFDCIVLTQTLHLIYDLPAAVRTLHRILKPGGVLLATMPGISQIDRDEWNGHWHWSLTECSAARLFRDVFPAGSVGLKTFGNVLAATSFLHGLAVEELKSEELDHHDPHYPVIIAVRAVKAATNV